MEGKERIVGESDASFRSGGFVSIASNPLQGVIERLAWCSAIG